MSCDCCRGACCKLGVFPGTFVCESKTKQECINEGGFFLPRPCAFHICNDDCAYCCASWPQSLTCRVQLECTNFAVAQQTLFSGLTIYNAARLDRALSLDETVVLTKAFGCSSYQFIGACGSYGDFSRFNVRLSRQNTGGSCDNFLFSARVEALHETCVVGGSIVSSCAQSRVYFGSAAVEGTQIRPSNPDNGCDLSGISVQVSQQFSGEPLNCNFSSPFFFCINRVETHVVSGCSVVPSAAPYSATFTATVTILGDELP